MLSGWRGLFGGLKRVHVGTDLAGNTYFEIPPQQGGRLRRVVDLKTPTRDGAAYDAEAVPAEWQTWLRFGRPDPPTHEELKAALQRRAAVQARAQHSALAHEQAKALLQAEHARLHAAAVANAAPEPAAAALPASTEPAGQGETFRPGLWQPGAAGGGGGGARRGE